eukprot:10114561-Prorocentrum_lima.AAC.1
MWTRGRGVSQVPTSTTSVPSPAVPCSCSRLRRAMSRFLCARLPWAVSSCVITSTTPGPIA